LLNNSIFSYKGITVDGTYVYWAKHSGIVGRANLEGSDAQEDFISGARIPSGNDLVLGVAVDGTNVYWSNFYSCTIGRANLDGSGINQRFAGPGAIEAVAVG
jgi:virginiamycin B lyase